MKIPSDFELRQDGLYALCERTELAFFICGHLRVLEKLPPDYNANRHGWSLRVKHRDHFGNIVETLVSRGHCHEYRGGATIADILSSKGLTCSATARGHAALADFFARVIVPVSADGT